MNREQKGEIVAQLTDRLSQSPNIYLTDFTGVTVKYILFFNNELSAYEPGNPTIKWSRSKIA